MSARRLVTLLIVLGTLVGALGSPSAAAAARPDLTITSVATYDVLPEERRVHVTVDLRLTNHLKDTKTKRFFYDEAFLDVMPHSSAFKLTTTGSGSPTVKVTKRTAKYTRLRLRFPRLYSGKSATYRLAFDLADAGGTPTRDIRIGDSLVSFPVWAFGTDSTPGSSVRVDFPAGFEVKVEAGSISEPTTDATGRTTFDTGELAKPLEFFAYLVADRPGAYAETPLTITVLGQPATLAVRSWQDDEPWATRVSGLLRQSLPVLGERIGLAWPRTDPLVVQEAVSRSTGGYAGLFDPGEGRVEIAYYADDFVVLHEAAHGWFNGALLADRWSNEAFASFYAAEAAVALDVKVRDDALTPELQAARIPLNAWGPVGRQDVGEEDYAYAAALALARAVAKRAGDDGLRAVWADAASGIGAYQPPTGQPERVGGPPDWRGLLDLLEARTSASYDDLWRTWVARPTDFALLDARTAARARLAAVTAEAADWRLPRPIRDALRAWRFEDATTLLDAASAALASRQRIDAAASAAGLSPPITLRLAFEDDDGFSDATAEAAAQMATIARYADAVALRPTTSDAFLALGLWGETPETDLVAAREAFTRGELEASVAASAEAAGNWSGALELGQGRALSIALLVLAMLLAIGFAAASWRRRRRARIEALRMAHPR